MQAGLSELTDLCNSQNRLATLFNLANRWHLDYQFHRNKKVINFHLPGTFTRYLYIAHYDVMYNIFDNANDNTASLINLLNFKLKCPNAYIVFTDKEEPPYFGEGAQVLASFIKKNLPNVEIVFNLELTGIGDVLFTDDRYTGYNIPVKQWSMPFNDSDSLIQNGVNSVCISLACKDHYEHLFNIHSERDFVNTIDFSSMDKMVSYLIAIHKFGLSIKDEIYGKKK